MHADWNRLKRTRITGRLRRWVAPRAADAKTALQERTVYALSIPTIAIFAAGLVLDLVLFALSQAPPYQAFADLLILACGLIAYGIARRGWARWGVLTLTFSHLAAFAFYTSLEGTQSVNLLLLLVAVAVAGMGLGWVAGFATATLSVLLYGLAVLAEGQGWFTPAVEISRAADQAAWENVTSLAIVVYLLASLIAVFAQWIYRTVQRQEAALRQQTITLQAANEEKATLVYALQERMQAQEELLAQLRASTRDRARLAETLRAAENPVIPVIEGVVVMPISGKLDAEHTTQLTDQLIDDLLAGAEKHNARLAILDITGLPEVSQAVAEGLLRMADTASLLGIECVLVGIHPQAARTLLDLGIDLSRVTSRRDLQSGIAYALERTGRRIVTRG